MKLRTLLAFVVLASSNLLFAECSDFPKQDGPVTKVVTLAGIDYMIKADFTSREVNSIFNVGERVTTHSYGNPRFFVDGREVQATRGATAELFRALGYEHIEYAIQTYATIGLFRQSSVLTGDLDLVRARRGMAVIDSGGYINPFHSACSDWVY
jgi:hypothetical protein